MAVGRKRASIAFDHPTNLFAKAPGLEEEDGYVITATAPTSTEDTVSVSFSMRLFESDEVQIAALAVFSRSGVEDDRVVFFSIGSGNLGSAQLNSELDRVGIELHGSTEALVSGFVEWLADPRP